MVSDVAHRKKYRVSTDVPYAMLDTNVLDDAAAPHLWGFNPRLLPPTLHSGKSKKAVNVLF